MKEIIVSSSGDKVIIHNVKNFVPEHIFDCGQCFRWNKQPDGSYTGVAHSRVINVKLEDDVLYLDNTNVEDFNNIWREYFDFDTDYDEIKKDLSKDKVMSEAIKHGYGIRILNQDPWETLISFIISANNGIKRIQGSIESLSERYGELIGTYRDKKYYAFPKAEVLQSIREEELMKSGVGYRANYIFNSSIIVAQKQMNIDNMENLSTEKARKELMLFAGVGPKVSDCIMLFSMHKRDAFPIDVWVKRVMEHFYMPQKSKLKDMQSYSVEKFGANAGFAQQYLFYYARELNIGKKKK